MGIFAPWNNYTVKLLQTITDKSFKSGLQWAFSLCQGHRLANTGLYLTHLLGPWITSLKFEGTSNNRWGKGNWAMTYSTAFLPFLSYTSNYPSCCSCHLVLHAHTQLLLPRPLNNGHIHCHWYVEQQHVHMSICRANKRICAKPLHSNDRGLQIRNEGK